MKREVWDGVLVRDMVNEGTEEMYILDASLVLLYFYQIYVFKAKNVRICKCAEKRSGRR